WRVFAKEGVSGDVSSVSARHRCLRSLPGSCTATVLTQAGKQRRNSVSKVILPAVAAQSNVEKIHPPTSKRRLSDRRQDANRRQPSEK
ncbi:hypothetical protein PFISCL1PPCAC_8901, partial [Pristionchus fissidentatus]